MKILDTSQSLSWHIKCDKEEKDAASKSFMMSGIPFPAGKKNCVLVLCMETSAETAIRDALIESRSFYKDFSNFSCEFAWTTDDKGRFSYVSEKGILSLGSQDLYGMDPLDLLAPDQDPKLCELVFKAQGPLSNMDIYLEHEGARKCYRFSVEPVFDDAGEWQGTRGIASDITVLKSREAELAALKDAETRTRNVVDAIRGEIRPDSMLETAASSIVRSGAIDACWIFHRNVDTDFTAENSPVLCAMPRRHKEKMQGLQTEDMRKIIGSYLSDDTDVMRVVRKDDLLIHVLPASYGNEIYGVLCFVRIAGEGQKWSETDLTFSRTVCDQTAISLALFEQHTRLQHLSRTDSLTGLLNRRAFEEEANLIIAHHKRMKRSAVMLYIDLDNFKKINDTQGHKVGDQIIMRIADLIKEKCRETDIAVRFGGDEFGVLLQESDETIALIKANDLIDGCHKIAQKITGQIEKGMSLPKGLEEICKSNIPQVGLSIGVSIFNPYNPESLESIIHRADKALYEVKNTGKGGYRLAPTPEQSAKSPDENFEHQPQKKAQR